MTRIAALGTALVPVALGALVMLVAPTRTRANIQEQRARLPPAARCSDDVEGIWLAHAYFPHMREWWIDRMELRRVPGSTTDFTGTFRSHYWEGAPPTDPNPPACAPGINRRIVESPGRGSIHDTRFEYGQTAPGREQVICGTPAPSYEEGRLTGTLYPSIHELHVTIDAGPGWQAVPEVFRRVQCLGERAPAQAHGPVARPPIAPPARSSGCGWPW